jgi:atypical dual specificity phosphatase
MDARNDAALLSFEGFGFAYGAKTILSDVDVAVGSRDRLSLVGPGAAGKSSLVRIVAGHCSPSLRTWGAARYAGAPLGSGAVPALLEQRARSVLGSMLDGLVEAFPDRGQLTRGEQRDRAMGLLAGFALDGLAARLDQVVLTLAPAEQRVIGLVRAFAGGAPLVCADEPCVGLDDDGAALVLRVLARVAEERAVVLVTHNRREALALGGNVALIAGGRVQEIAPVEAFFRAPATRAGEQYVQTGGCAEPSIDAEPAELDESFVAARRAEARDRLRWVLPGVLAGLPRPGLLGEIEADLEAVAAGGIRALFTLEEEATVPAALAARFGIDVRHFPIPDMQPPSPEDAVALCVAIDGSVAASRAVGVHCRAGLGRTGTVLCAHLVWRGCAFEYALDATRRVEPRFVQSASQLDFLRGFARTDAVVVARRSVRPRPFAQGPA